MTERSVALPPQALEVCMDHFIHEQNLAHYRKVLSETTDPTKRLTVLKLLADEQANHQPPCRDEASLFSNIDVRAP
jgi:hypothetical protein